MLQNLKFGDSFLPPSKFRPLLVIAVIAALSAIGIGVYRVSQSRSNELKPVQENLASVPIIKTVTALARLEPRGEVIKLSAPSTIEGSRVERLLVKEGDRVKTGQVVAILDNHDKRQAALEEAKGALEVARANLARVKAGAKQGEINAQQATIARLQAEQNTEIVAQQATIARLQAEQNTEIAAQQATIARWQAQLDNDQKEYQRNQQLYQQGAISASLRDSKRLAWQTAQQQINQARANLQRIQTSKQQQINQARANLQRIQASKKQQINEGKATLNRIAEVRPVDVVVAEAEVKRALATVKKAQADLRLAYVRSPQDGQVFKIYTRPGEVASSDGVLEIGQTSQMYAVVEVYQSDISKVRQGQKVLLTSDSVSGELHGSVERIGWQIQRQNVINSDPSSNIDARVVEVHVQLDDKSSQKAAKLTNLQVQAVIQL
ncbi:MAG: ABC exporter membrane fusion protein [Calothrix sp. MO_167.B12]|nr:ABC exporter membrane fusion protein [Calothrix sp. MO_167.B12]